MAALFVFSLGFSITAGASTGFLVSQGQARAAIVAGQGEFYGFVGQELQRYLEDFSGVKLDIVTPGGSAQATERLGVDSGGRASGQRTGA